jgi:arylsulfatase A-like enzyme
MSDKSMNRRTFLKLSTVTAAGIASGSVLGCGKKPENVLEIDPAIYDAPEKAGIPVENLIKRISPYEGRRPNIIVILCDDMGYGDLGCYGSTAIKTPNLDWMAREGMKFTDFYSSNALCSPSRAGLLTGRYPHRTGVTFPEWPKDDSIVLKISRSIGLFFANIGAMDGIGGKSIIEGLPLSEITLASALKVAGYKTAAIGKWHLGDFTKLPQYHPYKHGFDYFAGVYGANDDWPYAFWRGEKEIVHDIDLAQDPYTGIFTQEAVNFIEQSKHGPFFLYLAHKDPHQPNYPSKRFLNSSEAGLYGDTVQEVDWSVGEVLSCLQRNNLIRDTIILFTSDNGAWFNGSTGGLRGRKGQSYEGGFRVPMIAYWPGQIPAGNICSEPAMNIDFFPTFLALAGLTLPADRIIDGKNISGLMEGKVKQTPHDALFFFHHNEIEGVRTGEWKYFQRINHDVYPVYTDKDDVLSGWVANKFYTHTGKDIKGKTQTIPILGRLPLLYNMKFDPGENYNVINKYPDIGQRMYDLMKNWVQEFARNPRGWINK